MSLTIKPISAILDKDTDTLGKADPYVVFCLGKQKKQSKQCHNGGKKPTWNESITLNAKETSIKIQVWDKDKLSADDLMGQAQYDLKKVYATPSTPFTQYIKLQVAGKPSGQVLIQFLYNGPPINSGPQQGQQGWGQQQPQQQGLGQQGQQQGWGQQPQQPKQPQQGWGQQGQQQGWGQQGGQQGWGQQGGQQGGQGGQGGFIM